MVIADEAVSALDVSIRAQIINLMLDLQQEFGVAFLFISHDMAVVERISHRVAVMYLGQIVEIGPRRAVFENPQHAYTRRLLAAVPVADPSRRSMRARTAVRRDPQPDPRRRRPAAGARRCSRWRRGISWRGIPSEVRIERIPHPRRFHPRCRLPARPVFFLVLQGAFP